MTQEATQFTNRLTAIFAVAFASVLLSACGEMPARPANEQDATAAAGYGRAFGRVVYVEDGKEKEWSTSILAADMLTLFVRSTRTGQMQYMQIHNHDR